MKQKLLYLIVTLLVCCFQTNVHAQGAAENKKHLSFEQRVEMQAENVAKSLMLSDRDETIFVPLYVKYLKELRSGSRPDMQMDFSRENFSKEKMTDEKIDKLIKMRFEKCRKVLDIREKYYNEFKKILTPRQIMKMYAVERNFGKKMQNELEKRASRRKMKN